MYVTIHYVMYYQEFIQKLREIIFHLDNRNEIFAQVLELIQIYMNHIVSEKNKHDFDKMLPIVITNDNHDTKNDSKKRVNRIETYMNKFLINKHINAVLMVGPYISKHFVEYIKKSPVKVIRVIIDKNPPDYTKEALRLLYAFNYLDPPHKKTIQIRQRPKKSRFLHMKLMIPFYKTKTEYYSPCAIVGSVNFTRNGFSYNDELMVLLRDRKSIGECVDTLDSLWHKSKDVSIKDLK